MEAAEEALISRDDTGPHGKLLPVEKAKEGEEPAESNYVDLDMKPDGAKTVKVTFTGDGNRLSVIKYGEERGTGEEIPAEDEWLTGIEIPLNPLSELSDAVHDADIRREDPDLRYTDMYLNSRTESDDGASAVLSDPCGSDAAEDESHYITTHEIQLTELDHDADYDLGRGSSWDFEDDNLVYPFVDYAPFDGDDAQEGTLILEGRGWARAQADAGAALVGAEPDESDLCASSDESACKTHAGDERMREIHLSIKASTGAHGDGFSLVRTGAPERATGAQPPVDGAPYFIPAPGRQHLATKLRRKDINEYSSGASSSVSELDDADKEVRNLTAKSFRSLACPYFDAINLSTSSESSVSEYGLNKWSAYVDWNYGGVAHKASGATASGEPGCDDDGSARRRAASSGGNPEGREVRPSKQQQQQQQQQRQQQSGVTLNFRCNVEAAAGAGRSKNAGPGEVTGTVLARSGCEMQYRTDGVGRTHKRAIFASSLLKNVISKKMQFEQERKMERGEISDRRPAVSPCCQLRDQDRSAGRGLQRQTSESGSGFTGNSGDEQPADDPREAQKPDEVKKKEPDETPKALLSHSERSAFDSWKDDEPDAPTRKESDDKEELDAGSMLTKLLFVPSCRRFSKDDEVTEPSVSGPPQKSLQTDNADGGKEDLERGAKAPGIKICLRSVKENKGCTLNIANLLTPKISFNSVNTFRAAAAAAAAAAAGDTKYHILSASDKIPNFTVRDVRETKCKFQTPIYRVRDVRKLVKSSYPFVSLDGSDGKAAGESVDEKAKKEPAKNALPSPIVIKCQSVKTDGKPRTEEASRKQTEADAPSETSRSESKPVAGGRAVVAKKLNLDQPETQTVAEKQPKQRQEKFLGETAERRFEPKIPKQAALEKLKAAVKTMEQLYVFDRNEWKRKSQAPRPVTDSHVLSLIASEEQGVEEPDGNEGSPSIIRVPYDDDDTFKTQGETFSDKSVVQFDGNKAKSSETPPAPVSVKIEKIEESEKGKVSPATVTHGGSDAENYLAIPGYTSEIQVLKRDPASEEAIQREKRSARKTSPLIMEYANSALYRPPVAASQTQQVMCFSPPIAPARETVQHTQRKMLLDPTTGHYYLVDTPVQATTKRLFDPETGRYVDVPHSPVAPVTPVTPVPLALPPLAVSPGAYAPTYVIYPGFIPSPTLATQAPLPRSPGLSDDAVGEKLKNPRSPAAGITAEAAYYNATGETPHRSLPVSLRHVTGQGSAAGGDRKPIISITTQQGPRIIAPPSFDGTTMSFVVEHR